MLEPENHPELLKAINSLKQFAMCKHRQMGLQGYVDVDDGLQDVYVSVSLRQSSSPIESYKAYVRTCICNHLSKAKRARNRESRSNQPVETIAYHPPVSQDDDVIRKIQYLLTKLNDVDRKIIDYSFFENFNATQISERLRLEGYQLTPTNIRQRRKRALEKLRKLF